MASASPTQKTLAYCKSHGMLACVVERYVAPFGRPFGHRLDVWGFGDVLVLDGQPGSLLIQATSGTNVSSRVAKIRLECSAAARAWLAAGNRIQVWGWAKQGAAGQRKLWSLRVVHVAGEDLAPVELKAPHGRRRRRHAQQLELAATNGRTATGGQNEERTT
jgi:hypothetical protein